MQSQLSAFCLSLWSSKQEREKKHIEMWSSHWTSMRNEMKVMQWYILQRASERKKVQIYCSRRQKKMFTHFRKISSVWNRYKEGMKLMKLLRYDFIFFIQFYQFLLFFSFKIALNLQISGLQSYPSKIQKKPQNTPSSSPYAHHNYFTVTMPLWMVITSHSQNFSSLNWRRQWCAKLWHIKLNV